MKKTILLVVVTIFVMLSSCKNEKKAVTPELKKFKVSFELVANTRDSLQLFYSEDSLMNFKEEQSIWKHIEGNPNAQNITFELPAGLIPTFIRLDFTNKDQTEIDLKNYKMEYNGKIYSQNDSILNYLFAPSNVEFIDSLEIIKIKNDAEIFDPFIYSGETMKQKITELVK